MKRTKTVCFNGVHTHPPTHPTPTSLAHTSHKLTHSHQHIIRTHTHITQTHALTHSHSLGALRGVGCMPWRPLVSAALPTAFAWQARHLVLRQGVGCTPLASLGLRRSAGGFCVAGAALGALQGVGCTPWRPLVSAALPVGFAWQVRHLVLCKESDVRPGVPWSLPLCRWLLRGRFVTWCTARSRMYALASLGLRRSAGGFCVAGLGPGALQGVGCTLASLGLRRSAGGFCMAGVGLGALHGVGCTPWRPLVSAALPVAFAWQAWDLVQCKGSDVRPGVPWYPPLCRWVLRRRRGTWCTAKESDVRPGVPLVSAALPVAFAWQAWDLVHCKGSDVRPGVIWSPPLCRGFCMVGVGLGALPPHTHTHTYNIRMYPRGNFHSRTGEPVHSLNDFLNVLEF